MRIPKSFKIGGRKIVIEYDDKLDVNTGHIGRALLNQDKIILQPNGENTAYSISVLGETFLHELIHWLLCMSGENETLGGNEKFINIMASFLYQALTTMEYDND